MENHKFNEAEPEIVYSRSVKAGKRIYYLDVKKARNEDLYLCITESKKRSAGEAEQVTFEKHKVFLYKEDFTHFTEAFNDVVGFVQNHFGTIEEREEYVPHDAKKEDGDSAAEQPNANDEAPAIEDDDEKAEEQPQKRGLFSRLINR